MSAVTKTFMYIRLNQNFWCLFSGLLARVFSAPSERRAAAEPTLWKPFAANPFPCLCMSKKLSLSKSILGELSAVDDSDWRKSHNVGHKRKSRKESRRELRQAKKQKHAPNAALRADPKAAKPALQPAKNAQVASLKKSKSAEAKPKTRKSSAADVPFMSAHDMELLRKEEEDIAYYSKKLGIKASDGDDLFAGLGLDSDDEDGDLRPEPLPKDSKSARSGSRPADQGLRIVKEDELGLDDDSLSEGDFQEDSAEEMTAEETMAKLAALSRKKRAGSAPQTSDNRSKKASAAEEGLRIVKEDELGLDDDSLSEGDFDEVDEVDDDEEEPLRIVKEDELGLDDDSLSEGDFEASDNEEKPLRIVKEDELGLDDDSLSESDFEADGDDNEGLRIVKEDELGLDDDSLSEGDFEADGNDDESLRVVKADELGLDDDSLSDGDFGSDEEHAESNSDASLDEGLTAAETMARLKALKQKKSSREQPLKIVKEDELGADDDSLSEGDFDGPVGADDDSLSDGDFDSDVSEDDSGSEMTAEQTMAKLRALKAAKANKNARAASPDSEDDEDEDENPYVPPRARGQTGPADAGAVTVQLDTAAVEKMRKSFMGALNRLAEQTLSAITNTVSTVFLQNSVSEASTVFSEQLLVLVGVDQPVQHSLLTVYAALVSALYSRLGINFAASLVQTLVERIDSSRGAEQNLLTLFMEMYSLRVISAKLPYDMVLSFLDKLDEESIERILVILRTGGTQLRAEDPAALKNVILSLQQKVSASKEMSPRMRYLVDATVALKNNRQKSVSETILDLRARLRKQIRLDKEPLQVGLQDILSSKTRGKWWLVGASWRGNEANTDADAAPLEVDGDDIGAPNWLELAKKQRLNTDVRRAVFVALMGAEDYLEACIRIDKLGLKNRQERDIPHVVLHCLAQEQSYNPYYALVAIKQCAKHSTMKTFQFRLWDYLATNPAGNPQLAMHYGRFYAHLVHAGVMRLDILKTVDFLGSSEDTRVFLEVFFVYLYKAIAKDAERTAKRGNVHIRADSVDRDGKDLALRLSKIDDSRVLAGIKLINEDIARSEAVQTAKDRDRVAWAAGFANELVDELVRKLD